MAKSSNKWLERYTDGGLYIPLEGTSYVVRQQISKPRTYGDGGKYLTVNGEYHRVYENAEGDIMVNHPKEDKGKWDTINLTQKAKAKTIAQGIAATKKWHRENPEYANGGLGDGDPVKPAIPQNFVPIKWNAKTQKENELLQKSINERTKNTPEFKKARKLTKEEQDYSDKVKARIENPSADVGILAANMASALTRLQYLTPDEIKKITNNPKATTELAADILGQGLTNELIGGAVTVAPQAIKSVGKYLTEGPLKNAHNLNPWSFEPKPTSAYRMIGDEAGLADAVESKYLRPSTKGSDIGKIHTTTYYQIGAPSDNRKYFGRTWGRGYKGPYMAEVPNAVSDLRFDQGPFGKEIGSHVWTYLDAHIPTSEAKLYKQHWWHGYKPVSKKENGGWLNQYEQGGYADDSAVLNSEGQEVNTMQFALPTVPTFNFGNGDGDGEDPKNKKKSKDKKTDTRTVAQKRHDALEAAKTKILKTESPENKKKMDMLYSTTIAAENTYGYDPNAYGRKKQTRSPMSIDNIALDELFNPKGEKNRYTLQQKLNFDLLRSLGLPTDKAKLKELLETDDAYAGLGVAKTLYYNEGALKNLPNPTDTAAYINLYLNEYNKSGALKYQKRNELIDNITNKMRAQGKRKTKTIKPVVKNKTTK